MPKVVEVEVVKEVKVEVAQAEAVLAVVPVAAAPVVVPVALAAVLVAEELVAVPAARAALAAAVPVVVALAAREEALTVTMPLLRSMPRYLARSCAVLRRYTHPHRRINRQPPHRINRS
jgi:hypothetical protein